jgi:dihydrofolate synthase/folylpolyglutamate synthase
MQQDFSNWSEIENLLQNFIPNNSKKLYSGDWGLQRMREILEKLDNPQNKIQIFHIAGTSGKGSTAFLLSQILESQNLKTGLSLSPYLLDFRERFMINNKFADKHVLVENFNSFWQKIEKTVLELKPTYFELITIFTFYFFWKQKVDVAVIEVGLGGLMDATNVITNPDKISILNQIGFDHTDILGNTLTEIAVQKAGIILPKSKVVTIHTVDGEAMKVYKKTANEKNVTLFEITENDYQILDFQNYSQNFSYKSKDGEQKINLKMLGDYQVHNCLLALKATEIYLPKIDWQKLKEKLAIVSFVGRFEIETIKNQILILDSAHNPQKMQSFIDNLKIYFPNQKFTFVLAFSHNKDAKTMLDFILPLADKLIFTEFDINQQTPAKKAYPVTEILEIMKTKKVNIEIKTFQTPKQAVAEILDSKNPNPIVFTGSIYFLGYVYREFGKVNLF